MATAPSSRRRLPSLRTGEPPEDRSHRDDDQVDVRRVQPYQALKMYLCPGCQQEILPATGHLVVVPRFAEDRRHWHVACWEHRQRRRPGR